MDESVDDYYDMRRTDILSLRYKPNNFWHL